MKKIRLAAFQNKVFIRNVVFIVGFCLLFFSVFKALQYPSIYDKTLGMISENYEHTNEGIAQTQKPYTQITNENLIHWDAIHYKEIRDNGYACIASKGGDHIFAFFPLFPYVWRMSHLPAEGVVFLNFLFYGMGLLLLLSLFPNKQSTNIFLMLSLPFVVIYFTPHTEALFFLLFSIAAWAFVKNKYWIYFIAMFAVALTRNAFTLVFPAIVCAEIIFLLKERNVSISLKRCLQMIFPILLGTGILMLIQYSQGSQSFIKFLTAQSHWDHHLRLPNLLQLSDWSYEGFGMNVTTLIIIGLPIIVYISALFFKQLGILQNKVPLFIINSSQKRDYLFIISLFCCLASISMPLLFQNKNLHGLSRFVLAAPYFVFSLLYASDHIKQISIIKKVVGLLVLIFLSCLTITNASYFVKVNFALSGMLILIVTMTLYCLQNFANRKLYKILLYINLLFNVLWTTYLFNVFISNGWIFA